MVKVALIGPGFFGSSIRFTVQTPPGGTGTPFWSWHVPPLMRKSGLSTVTEPGMNDEGPWLASTRYHSGPG